jgi:serine/threonine protein kinase
LLALTHLPPFLVADHNPPTPPFPKSDNVLLCFVEGRWLAKVADFGTARYAPALLEDNTEGVRNTHHQTQTIIGTKPYMPPEYLSGQVSERTDTFAFGVVLLELLTGKPPRNEATSEFLHAELALVVEEAPQQLPPLLDRRAGALWPLEQALALAAIAKKCLEMTARKRCVVADVLSEIDALAGRMAVVRAGRGEEYDPMTGELVKKKPRVVDTTSSQ